MDALIKPELAKILEEQEKRTAVLAAQNTTQPSV